MIEVRDSGAGHDAKVFDAFVSEGMEPPQAAPLNLSPGWHSLLLKLVMQHDEGQSFGFAARFTDVTGLPAAGIKTQLGNPTADLALNVLATRLGPLVYVDAPG